MTEDWRAGGFAIYVHWPFCAAKCPYCDFNSHVWRNVDQAAWKTALIDALRREAEGLEGREVTSVFFGGGTPSLMPAETVAAVVGTVDDFWGIGAQTEITLEANPTSVEAARLAGYRDAGVNRVSLGVQALNDADLQRLGRLHSAGEALRALDLARGLFDRVSFDLIYARQDQTAADWEAELRRALALGVEHLSLYQLTIEPQTRFGELAARGRLRGLPSSDRAADLYRLTNALCAEAGIPLYEISNYARPGQESRHNLVYWRYGDYLGVGPGAHGRLTRGGVRQAIRQFRDPARWAQAVRGGGSGCEHAEPLPARDQAVEMLMMGLRLPEGLPLARLARLDQDLVSEERLSALIGDGVLSIDDERLRATARGREVLDRVLNILINQQVTQKEAGRDRRDPPVSGTGP